MDWENIAPMVVSIVLFLTVAGVIVLRPISKQLGKFLEVMALEKADEGGVKKELRAIRELLENQNQRLALLEERQDFTDALLGRASEQRELPGAAGDPDRPG